MTSNPETPLSIINRDFVVSPEALPTRTCHAATLVEALPGLLMAAWFGGSQEGEDDVRIWGAHHCDGQWSDPILLTGNHNANPSEAHWNPVLFNDGQQLHFHYKVGQSPRSWQGFHKVSSDNGYTWSSDEANPDGYLGPIRNKPLILPDKTFIYPSSTEHQGWKIHFEIEKGSNRERISVEDPQMLGAIQPALLHHSNGRIQTLCRTHSGVIAESWSSDSGHNWSPLHPTRLPNLNSAIDALTLSNGSHILVYNPVVAGRTPLTIALSTNGVDWQQAVMLKNDDGEFSYPTVIESHDGTLHILYTWQRKAIRHVQLNVTH